MKRTTETTRKGFTLVELAVVIVIIGVLAAFGVPQFLKSVERSKAAEAFNYLSAVRSAQERYISKEGVYCDNSGYTGGALDINQGAPKYFTVGEMTGTTGTGGNDEDWSLKLARIASTSAYGSYTVTFSKDGYSSTSSTISSFTDINPMGR
jgi:type IV pilus assembly protein PilA